MRSPKIFEAEHGDFVFVSGEMNIPGMAQMVVIVSGVSEEIQNRFGMEALSQCLQQLKERETRRVEYLQRLRERCPTFFDKDGNYLSDEARNSVAH